MEVFGNVLDQLTNYLMTMTVSDYVDIILIAYIIYRVVMFIRKTNSRNIAIGALIFVIVLWLSEVTKLTMVNTLMRKAVELGLIALLILFQPELRRMLERMGSSLTDGRYSQGTDIESAIDETVSACADMSYAHTGALIVFVRSVSINHVLSTGTLVNSDTTAELIKNIFFVKAPLHDGALVIQNCRIAAAGCVLPLTQNKNLSKELGTRHRAGIGMSEQSDAVVVIVSEETGAISVAVDGNLKRHLSQEELRSVLRKELVIDEENVSKYDSMMKFVRKLMLLDDGREDRR
ncbi:MAG: diadenylate cyclase CdaA [Eubacteriales bacterium]|nr:diadenylate cyclase CdaA [Eubacteriales bacterium]